MFCSIEMFCFFKQKSVKLKMFFLFPLSHLKNRWTKSSNWKNGTLFMWTETSPHTQKQMLNSILIRPDQFTLNGLQSKWSLRVLIIWFLYKIRQAVVLCSITKFHIYLYDHLNHSTVTGKKRKPIKKQK